MYTAMIGENVYIIYLVANTFFYVIPVIQYTCIQLY